MFAQTVAPCATNEFTNKLRAEHPHLQQDFDNYNQSITTAAANRSGERRTTYIIPVVFHVLHTNGTENISDQKIFDQVARLNVDYNGPNPTNVIRQFRGLMDTVNIEFRLAQLDPNGNCTNGIERIYTHKTNQADNGSKLNQWPRDKYLNIWVVKDIAGSTPSATILGYAQFPSDVNGPLYVYDGIVAVFNTINGTSTTMSHEIGHWLNLQHTWGSTNEPNVACGDDLVSDTPQTKGHFSTCPILDAVCTTNPFTANFGFDSLTTASGTTDPTPNPVITAVTNTDFTAVGVSPNSSANQMFAYSDWGLGAPDGATTFSALTGAINTGKYYEVKFTPQFGYSMKYTQINFKVSRNATGARTFAIRSSRDGFANNLGTSASGAYAATASVGTADAANMGIQSPGIFFIKNDITSSINSGKIVITGTSFTNDTMPVTFRIYAWNAEDAAGTFSIDSINFIGSSDQIENVENYMDYSNCTEMFTHGQGTRMRTALESSVSDRNNLWSADNLAATGVLTPQVCKPFPDFYVNKPRICAGGNVTFTKNIQHGTPDSIRWTFYGGTPSTSTSTAATINVVYPTAGLYKVVLVAYNAGGTDSVAKTDYIRVDETWAEVPYGGAFLEDFQNTSDFYWKWQVHNYDNNPSTWYVSNTTGYLSTKSVVMAAHNNYQYDVDDLVSPSFDLSYTSGNIMTFRCAAASTAGAGFDVNDKLNVYASSNCGTSWTLLKTFKDSTLINNGYSPFYFTPTSSNQWALRTVNIPATFAVGNVRFKFEYTSGSASNNVWLDDINITGVVGIDENNDAMSSLAIYPNPTNQSSTIAYHLSSKADTRIEVVDVLGKVVFVQSNSNQPEGDYKVNVSKQNLNLRNGIYFVKFSVDNKSTTKKLIITE
jgi:hypothetical protein